MTKQKNKKRQSNKQTDIVQMMKYSAVALSFVSFLTTLNGLNGIVTDNVMIAGLISFGIQAIILVMGLYFINSCSIVIQKKIHAFFKCLLIIFMILLYIISIGFSSIFSYVYISNAAYNGVRNTDYNTEIEKFLIDNTKELKIINDAANYILLDTIRNQAPQFTSLLNEYKDEAKTKIDDILITKVKYEKSEIPEENKFNIEDAANAFFSANGYNANEETLSAIRVVEISINHYITMYNDTYYRLYSNLFDEMKQQTNEINISSKVDEIANIVTELNEQISTLNNYTNRIGSISIYTANVCNGIVSYYNRLIGELNSISDTYTEIGRDVSISGNNSLSLQNFYEALYSPEIIDDNILENALNDLNEIIVTYINNSDTIDTDRINALSQCITYLEELQKVRAVDDKITSFQNEQLNKTYIIDFFDSTQSESDDKSSTAFTSMDDSDKSKYNYNRISEEKWNEERHKDMATFIDIAKSLPDIQILIQNDDLSTLSNSVASLNYLKEKSEENYISNTIAQAYDYNRNRLENISDIERARNYLKSDNKLLACFCLIIAFFLDIASMFIGFFLYTCQKTESVKE